MSQVSVTIYCMLVACLLPFSFTLIAKIAGGFKPSDNQNPRLMLAKLPNGLAARAHAAQLNSFETLPVFLAAVLMAQYMIVPQAVINNLAIAYVLLRVLYGIAYLANWASFRSVIWFLGLACPILLFVSAARIS
ncbi:MAG: MAPEG family protein [Pseudomonadota bacterium]|nr:MAPEG family protein [Pseudomonadota bacterium]